MDDENHREEATVYLMKPLKKWLISSGRRAFVGANSFIYYDPKRPPAGPDFYVVNGGEQRRQSKWVAWEEQNLLPTLIVEMLSPSTEANDRGKKFLLYRDRFQCPDYYLFKIEDGTLEGFRLEGRAYVAVQPDALGHYACASLPLKLGLHQGWLRFFELDGNLVPTDDELAEQERQAAARERQAAEWERARADQAEAELERLRAELKRLQG